jgi:hypothetical protein
MNHIIFFSGGKASFSVADYVKSHYPNDNIVLYFTDTLWENQDLYRFIKEASDKIKLPLLTHSTGLNPMQLMFEKKMVYNSRIGDCSKLLKMKVARDFLKKGVKPKIEYWRNKEYLKEDNFTSNAFLYFGIGFMEAHREKPIKENWKPFNVQCPLIDNFIDDNEILKKYNIKQPELYDLGFSHNNCNARCVKAGQGHYRNLKEKMPKVFKKIMEQEHHLKLYVSSYRYFMDDNVPEHEKIPEHVKEQELKQLDDAYRDYFYDLVDKPKFYIHPAGSASEKYMKIKQYSFMKKDHKPYPIRDFNIEIESNMQIDLFDIGGCGCFLEYKTN